MKTKVAKQIVSKALSLGAITLAAVVQQVDAKSIAKGIHTVRNFNLLNIKARIGKFKSEVQSELKRLERKAR